MSLHRISVSSATHIDDGYSVEVELDEVDLDAAERIFAALSAERDKFDLPRINPRALVRFGDPLPLPEDL